MKRRLNPARADRAKRCPSSLGKRRPRTDFRHSRHFLLLLQKSPRGLFFFRRRFMACFLKVLFSAPITRVGVARRRAIQAYFEWKARCLRACLAVLAQRLLTLALPSLSPRPPESQMP